MGRLRPILLRCVVAAVCAAPVAVAATSPLLAFRDPVYVAACLAGVVGLSLLLLQPLLIGGSFAGLAGRRLHAWVGGGLVVAVVAHVGGLWLTSPPDVVDVLLLRSPTPFAPWGLAAMGAVVVAAVLAAVRRRRLLRPPVWRALHVAAAIVIVVGTVVHALLIEGTMGTVSKAVLCAAVLAAAARVVADTRPWTVLARRRA
jgi:hypothetical protein